MRLFFALWPSAALQAALASAARATLVDLEGARAVPSEQLHVTLAFLGVVAPERLEAAQSAAGEALEAHALASAGGQPPGVRLGFERLEHWRRAQVLCATATAPPAARSLAAALRHALLRAGFTPDLKPFRAHVTLARHVRRAPAEQPFHAVIWPLECLALVESETRPEGSLYSIRSSWTLSA